MICTPIYTLSTTICTLYTPYLQPIFTYVHLIYNLYAAVYSYFEKGCRKKCTRQSRRALWMVLSALFFKQSGKKGTGGHGQALTSATYIDNLYTPYGQPIFTIYTLFTTYIHLCTPYSQPIFTYIHLIYNLYTPYTNYISELSLEPECALSQ